MCLCVLFVYAFFHCRIFFYYQFEFCNKKIHSSLYTESEWNPYFVRRGYVNGLRIWIGRSLRWNIISIRTSFQNWILGVSVGWRRWLSDMTIHHSSLWNFSWCEVDTAREREAIRWNEESHSANKLQSSVSDDGWWPGPAAATSSIISWSLAIRRRLISRVWFDLYADFTEKFCDIWCIFI